MKKTNLVLLLFLFGALNNTIQAQELSVEKGTGFNIKSGTVLSVAGLDLSPSTDFSLSSSLSLSSAVSNATITPYINRSYQFIPTTEAFSGVLRINYQDTELNGLVEISLKLLYNTGGVWSVDNSSTNDVSANYVNTTLTAKTLNELSLGNNTNLTVEEFPIITKFSVMTYPNPFANSFKLEITTSSLERVKVSIFDAIGRLIEQRNTDVSEIANQEMGSNYPSGVYTIIVTQDPDTKTLRVIKK
ncbi:T9SS type A sorting domain-containing protein [Flavobacterium lacustre]|uniref:T9SS type A sorting domain-containing protein n=1 Tax=Flavobacterium lacustre TaxID=3016339 RepID=UPI0022B5F78E|nr:T9SS type A sorting domain-containing protein [Flavobacterium lacustre]